MTAFCVYGVTRSRCLDQAKKKVDLKLVKTASGNRMMKEAEWEFSVGLAAAIIYTHAKAVAVSPRFDAPQFAREWMNIAKAKGELKEECLMALAPTGELHPKTREPFLKWAPYALVKHKYEYRAA